MNATEKLLHQMLQVEFDDRRDIAIEASDFCRPLTRNQLIILVTNFAYTAMQKPAETPAETPCAIMMRFAQFVQNNELNHDPLYLGMLIGQFIMSENK